MDKKQQTERSKKCLDDNLDIVKILQNVENFDVISHLIKKITENETHKMLEVKQAISIVIDFLLIKESLSGSEIEMYKKFRDDLRKILMEIERVFRLQNKPLN